MYARAYIMKTASGRVPEDLWEWLEKEGEKGDSSKAKVLREALTDARAAQEGDKVLVEPSSRESVRLADYADREGLMREEAARELLQRALEEDRAVTNGDLLKLNPPEGVADSVAERADRDNMSREEAAVRFLEDGISSRTRIARATDFMSTVVVYSTAALVGVLLLPELPYVSMSDVPGFLLLSILGVGGISLLGALVAKVWQQIDRAREANLSHFLPT